MCGDEIGWEYFKLDEIDPLLFVFVEEQELLVIFDDQIEEDPIGFYYDNLTDEQIEEMAREFHGSNYQPMEEDSDSEDEF